MSAGVAQRAAFGRALVELAERYPKMVVLDPDVCPSTQTSLFRAAYPDRFYPMGIAEANAVCVAAGLASCGFVPWVSAFAVFLATRAADQVRVSVAHARQPVKLNGAYGGLPSGRGGATHSAVEDIAVMRTMPNMIVLTPADAAEAGAMVELAMETSAPVYLRTMRCELPDLFGVGWRPDIGRAVELAPGDDVAILSEGMMSARALEAAAILRRDGIAARVLHFGTIKPFDAEAVAKAARECGALVSVENHSRIGGLGSAVCEAAAESDPAVVVRLGFPDCFLESGDDERIFSRYGLDPAGIAAGAREALRRNGSDVSIRRAT
ncbi:MAG TPA: transketolase C-terminal domain-containing protein [Spirochaetales bacterium]|mgnify:CR=1 FL=1|nr:transketolase C-terminal domain-containing protein [Spirochaetales bacterium]HPM72019.1 transketolase C-terminal domain-containing protein [Spirochaetales bacterium]